MKYLLFIGCLLPFFGYAQVAKPVIDGNTNDAAYTTMAVINANDGFGSLNNVKAIKVYADATDIYVAIPGGVSGDPINPNHLLLWVDFSGYDGADAGSNVGTGTSVAGIFDAVGLNGAKIDMEVDYAFDFNIGNSATDHFIDVVRYGSSNTIFENGFLGTSNQNGTAISLPAATVAGFSASAVEVAFNNSKGTHTGWEMKLSLAGIAGVASTQTARFFAAITSNTGFFSNEFLPVLDYTGANLGDFPDFTSPTLNNGGPGDFTSAAVPLDGSTISGVAQTEVVLDADGHLWITDVNGGSSNDNLVISTSGANIQINDSGGLAVQGYGTGVTNSNASTVLVPAASITSGMTINTFTGTDNISFATGLSLALGTGNLTVNAESITLNGAVISSTSGTVSFTSSKGTNLSSGSITTTSGAITINANTAGTATGNFNGIDYSSATITSQTGNISLTGKGGSSATAGNNGIEFSGGQISSTGTGGSAATITINGTGGTATEASRGINATGAISITTVDGAVSISGTGGNNSGVNNIGISLKQGSLASTGTGSITVNGTGGTGGSSAFGIEVLGPSISATNGNVSLSGTSNTSNQGFRIGDGSSLNVTGSGNITLTGNSAGTGLEILGSAGTIGGGSGAIAFMTDRINIEGGTIQSSGALTVKPITAGTTIALGDLSTGTLKLSTTGISRFSDGFSSITIGDATSGNIQVGANFTDPLTLLTGGLIEGSTTTDIGNATNAVALNGNVAPGNSAISSFDVTGNLSLTSGKTLTIKIDAATTAGTSYDQLNVTGTVNLAGATLSLSGTYVPVAGNVFTILANDGTDAITGTFNGLAQGGTLSHNGVTLTISYTGGDGNDITLTAPNPPSITPSVTTMSGFATTYGLASASQSYTVSSSGLTANLSITVDGNYEISTDNLNFSQSLSIAFATANGGAQTIFVRIADYACQGTSLTAVITHASTGATSKTIDLTGAVGSNATIIDVPFNFVRNSDSSVTISWPNPSGNIRTFDLLRATGNICSPYTVLTTGITTASPSFTDNTITGTTLYYYKIRFTPAP